MPTLRPEEEIEFAAPFTEASPSVGRDELVGVLVAALKSVRPGIYVMATSMYGTTEDDREWGQETLKVIEAALAAAGKG